MYMIYLHNNDMLTAFIPPFSSPVSFSLLKFELGIFMRHFSIMSLHFKDPDKTKK